MKYGLRAIFGLFVGIPAPAAEELTRKIGDKMGLHRFGWKRTKMKEGWEESKGFVGQAAGTGCWGSPAGRG